jgi:hypothetical protein
LVIVDKVANTNVLEANDSGTGWGVVRRQLFFPLNNN